MLALPLMLTQQQREPLMLMLMPQEPCECYGGHPVGTVGTVGTAGAVAMEGAREATLPWELCRRAQQQ